MQKKQITVCAHEKRGPSIVSAFGAVNGQDFRTPRDPLGRFTLFLISQLVSRSRMALTQGRAGPAGVETAGRERVLQSRRGRIELFIE